MRRSTVLNLSPLLVFPAKGDIQGRIRQSMNETLSLKLKGVVFCCCKNAESRVILKLHFK